MKKSEGIFSQIDRIDKSGNELTVVPTGKKIVISAGIEITIKADNKITIDKASASGVSLSMKGISTIAGDVKKAVITPKGYTVKVGWLPEYEGKF